ncbi:MAG: TIM barrel protein [Bacteroidales bacterium]|nr:TIM barrel protein [Bacteroidales bacterium]
MNKKSSRRSFLATAAVTGSALFVAPAILAGNNGRGARVPDADKPFSLKFAPSPGMFRGLCGSDDAVDNIKFMHDKGFTALFDNDLPDRTPEAQERIAAEVQRLGMTMGPWVLYADFSKTSFVLDGKEIQDFLKTKMQEGIEVAHRTGFKMALVVPGRYDERLHPDYQRSNVIDNLKYCAEFMEPEGIKLVIEPLNTLHDHPGLWLTGMPQAFQVCNAVNSPSVKIVEDIYHQQITEGNLIPNIESCWDQIAAFHVGDNPGRNEPTTGEINYANIFKYLRSRDYEGVICMEHGRSLAGQEGEKRVIEAYRECDPY